MPLAVGAEFAGFRIVRELGAGGMGQVYLVEHPRLPRQEAVKVLSEIYTDNQEYRQRFQREAELAASLWHPHLVALHDRGEAEGRLWISMDYIDGTDTARLVRTRYPGGMPVAAAVEIIASVASALDYAHGRGMLHRDVKPSNILYAEPAPGERRIALADFGIAREINDADGITSTNFAVGTVEYAAPEQLMSQVLDGRADQYALAATGFHLLTGAAPFPGTNPATIIGHHLTSAPPPLSSLRPELAALDAVFATAMAKNPAQRYSSCGEFAADLQRHAASVSVASNAATQAAPSGPAVAAPNAPTMAAPIPALSPGLNPEDAVAERIPAIATGIPQGRTGGRLRALVAVLAVLLVAAGGFAINATMKARQPAPDSPVAWQPYLDAGRTFAETLTSHDYKTADADTQRVIDASTGQFRDDFTARAAEFTRTLRDVRAVTKGTAGGAGVEAVRDSEADVLVAVTTERTDTNAPESEPRITRLRITMVKSSDGTYKASKVSYL
jgi:serine/threonine-protein kinase